MYKKAVELLEQDLDWRSQKWFLFPDLVLNISQVGEMGQGRIIHVQKECGGIGANLGCIVDFEMSARLGR